MAFIVLVHCDKRFTGLTTCPTPKTVIRKGLRTADTHPERTKTERRHLSPKSLGMEAVGFVASIVQIVDVVLRFA
jgi:hypothetical protein